MVGKFMLETLVINFSWLACY